MDHHRTTREIRRLLDHIDTTVDRGIEQLADWSATISSPGGPGQKGGHSDPAGNRASRGLDPHADAIRTLEHSLRTARDHLDTAYQKILMGTVKADKGILAPPCISCQRERDHHDHPYYRTAFRANLCKWCYDWQNDNGGWPPVQLLRIHHRGDTITPRLIAKYGRSTAAPTRPTRSSRRR